jgi:hypothetical protein
MCPGSSNAFANRVSAKKTNPPVGFAETFQQQLFLFDLTSFVGLLSACGL